jgi:phage baseplate assembly protein W
LSGFSPKFPLFHDQKDGFYGLNKEFRDVVTQNLKNLVLTAQGERVMDADFGVGLYGYLFEPLTVEVITGIKDSILGQTKKYLPFVEIEEVTIDSNLIEDGIQRQPLDATNYINIRLVFSIPSLGVTDALDINLKE